MVVELMKRLSDLRGKRGADRALLVVQVDVAVPRLEMNRPTLVIERRVINGNTGDLDKTGFNSVDQAKSRKRSTEKSRRAARLAAEAT